MKTLVWPEESPPSTGYFPWHQDDANACLDIHGRVEPDADCAFIDSTLHGVMRRINTLAKKLIQKQQVYATLPNAAQLQIMHTGGLRLGQLELALKPNVFIVNTHFLPVIASVQPLAEPVPLFETQGMVMLIAKTNPKQLTGIADLFRADIKTYFPNPATERESFNQYYNAVKALALSKSISLPQLDAWLSAPRNILFGTNAHHRELPKVLAAGYADTAIVHYHMARYYMRAFPEYFAMVYFGEKPLGTVYHPLIDIEHFVLTHTQTGTNAATQLLQLIQHRQFADTLDDLGLSRAGLHRLK